MNEFLEGKTPHFSCCFSQPELHSPLITTAASNTYHPPITSTAAVLYSLSLSLFLGELPKTRFDNNKPRQNEDRYPIKVILKIYLPRLNKDHNYAQATKVEHKICLNFTHISSNEGRVAGLE